jgi:hypothetical protein
MPVVTSPQILLAAAADRPEPIRRVGIAIICP